MPGSVNASGLIAPQKVQLLLDIIQNSSIIDDGLTACGLEFSSLFQTRAERFKARCWITNVLTKSALKAVKQRLVALFLLQCDYACDARSLPFLHVFLQVCNPLTLTLYYEQACLSEFVHRDMFQGHCWCRFSAQLLRAVLRPGL